MNEKKMNWDDLKLFLAVARTGGLSAASHATGKSAPTLGRRMQALERATGEELFHRQARGYELTEQGNALLIKLTDLETPDHAARQVIRSKSQGIGKSLGGKLDDFHALSAGGRYNAG